MKVAIIGAGFGGLAIAYKLVKRGVEVTIFESDDKPGGLAVGFKEPQWKWSIEKHYHHWFTSDWAVRNLAKEIGHKVIVIRPKTSTLIDGKIKQLDSPLSLMLFDKLPLFDRFRMAAVLAYLKITPFWKPLERITAEIFIKRYMGKKTWKILWEPLFKGKFDKYLDDISAAWFWARIKKRSISLCYPEGGFLEFAQKLTKSIENIGGKVLFKTPAQSIYNYQDTLVVKTTNDIYKFDKVICTLSAPLFIQMTRNLPKEYTNNLLNLNGIGAVNLVLSLKKQFLKDGSYWLNINRGEHPFLAVVEHTNFMDKANYNNEHLVYIGNYVEHSHQYFKFNEDEIFYEFYNSLRKINPHFNEKWINNKYLFKAYFAQPIYPLNYSKNIPSFETPIKGLYLCNIQQVYPWDRGTNYAVENGEKVAELLLKTI
ncbi:MAG: hypothetical protein US60_C0017G0007 [Microgenomates group bacterium GW2011_GWC1_37_8]|uniref:Amine oxidase domain-containing protein n=1 Tax=Candidatus Woesebacteria bacterium GW2011_GWB1_38_8 TaxID=1618570 RepID=A0A0G0L2K5_9BACT|nr:MAG: hypothetical protein US60_C0017G0007 [Microgenomates group bacterium GW2011_GWC1_37_8]KKQ86198.1 MAG: hypothetical protein UT08_C0001G0064 [Candidatus Woesebacteria bacterium GW2011_GWB1_38_8]